MRYFLGAAFIIMVNPAAAETLDAKAIQAELVGQHISWSDAQGVILGDMVLSPGGLAHITITVPQQETDDGHWTLEGDKLCTVWSTMRPGQPKCYTLRQTAPGHFVTSGGNEFSLLEFSV